MVRFSAFTSLIVVAALQAPALHAQETELPATDASSLEETLINNDGYHLSSTVIKPAQLRILPNGLEQKQILIQTKTPVTFEYAVTLVSNEIPHPIVIEERPGRSLPVILDDPIPFVLKLNDNVTKSLNKLAELSGYDWNVNEDEEIVFYRYHDADQRKPIAADRKVSWTADPALHKNLQDVLTKWAYEADWKLVWKAAKINYSLQSKAEYYGDFTSAVDQIMLNTREQHQLIPTAYTRNKHLVITDGSQN